jgi:hypothetical protein
MSLAKTAQSVEFWEDETEASPADDNDLSVGDEVEDEEGQVMLQINDEEPITFNFSLPKLPGAELDDEIEEEIDVDEPEDEVEVAERDKWDWEGGGLSQFLPWLQGMFGTIPKYRGHETSGVERAIAFLERLDSCISRAVRNDLKDELDISQVENARKEIREGVKRLKERLERLTVGTKKKKVKSSTEYQDMIVKEAQKISGVNRTTITVDILLARVAKVCINGMVSGGHDIEKVFDAQVKKYGLNVREQASVLQLLEDFGYAIRRDRGFLRDEEIDVGSSDNFDWAAQYYA